MTFKKVKTAFISASFIFLLSGCSWQEYFMVTNETTSDITIEYSISSPGSGFGFGIFETTPTIYKLTPTGSIDWNDQLSFVDTDTTSLGVTVLLPAKSSVVIGYLSNDHYKKHDQQFINGRTFNLKKINLNSSGKSTEIIPENFDSFFKKSSGNIEYRVK
ncbi:MAG: hypothetical protein V4511_01525 [Bacteroidota bacterium]